MSWDGECVEPADLTARIERWLERDRIDARLSIRVSGRDAPELGAEFELHSSDKLLARRQFRNVPGDCSDLRAVLSFGIALAIDAALLSSAKSAPPPPQAAPPPSEAEPQRPSTEEEAESQLRAGLWMDAGLLAAVLPKPTASAALGGGVRIGESLWLRGGLFGTLPNTVEVGEGQARVVLVGLQLDGCWIPRFGDWGLSLCGGGVGGGARATGERFASAQAATQPWAALQTGVGGERHFGSDLALGLHGMLMAALVRPRLTVESESGTVLESAELGVAGAGLGMSLRWLLH